MHHKSPHRKAYAGRVLDGPFEGDWIEGDEPYFQGTFTRRLRPVTTYGGEQLASAEACLDQCYYRWLDGYRAWAWVQPLTLRNRSNG